jgi:hypothetical protein
MSTDDVSIRLVSIDCEHEIGDEKDTVQMLRKAFAAAKHHFMITEADPQFKGALNAVLVKMGDEHPDRQRLETEIGLLGKFNAFLRAAQAGLNPDIPEVPEGFEAFDLNKLWTEAR